MYSFFVTPLKHLLFMMKTVLIAIVWIICFYACTQKQTSDLERLRERVAARCLSPDIREDRLKSILASVREDGTWPGIDYDDTSRIAFRHVEHLDNLLLLARAFKKVDSEYFDDPHLRRVMDASLNFWLDHDFLCENWWHNQIGTPNAMITLLFILDDDLTQLQRDRMVRIAGRANMEASGARPSGDRVKIAGLFAKTALFCRQEKRFEEILRVIEGEMKVFRADDDADGGATHVNYFSGGRGMQQDYSFHHRPDRVNNTTTYGLSFLSSFVEFAEWVNDTKYKFSDRSLRLSVDYFLDGVCKQMVYGRSVDPGVMNREMARRDAGRIAGTDLPESLRGLSDYRKEELENIVRVRRGEPFEAASFAKFFWQTEYFSFQRPAFFASVRMFSTRNDNMEEPYNGEGLLNHFRADGACYLSVEGMEYLDIAPVFDYRKIPGATIVQVDSMPDESEVQKKGLTDFVGGVTDGVYGAVAFDFESPHNPLSAKKSWFFFDDLYVCLGAAINSTDGYPVATTLNQCLLKGETLVNDGVKTRVMERGKRLLAGGATGWIFHDRTGYVFPGGRRSAVGLSNRTESGSWYRVNRQTGASRDEVEEEVFCLWIDHGVRPVDAGYEYVVMPAAGVEDVERFVENPSVRILSNTSGIQAVGSDRMAYCVFYEAGEVRLCGDLRIRSEAPCMVLVHLDGESVRSVAVADPSRKLETVALTVLGADGRAMSLSVDLPREDFAGMSKFLQSGGG
jgi:chondroitin AC lyase